jgi:hypothetical protein
VGSRTATTASFCSKDGGTSCDGFITLFDVVSTHFFAVEKSRPVATQAGHFCWDGTQKVEGKSVRLPKKHSPGPKKNAPKSTSAQRPFCEYFSDCVRNTPRMADKKASEMRSAVWQREYICNAHYKDTSM